MNKISKSLSFRHFLYFLSAASAPLLVGCEHQNTAESKPHLTSTAHNTKAEMGHISFAPMEKDQTHPHLAKNAVTLHAAKTESHPDALTSGTQKGQTSNEDPLENFNRTMFSFNELIDGLFLKPAAQIYELCLHEDVREGINNVLQNLGSPLVLVNDILQGSPEKAGETFQRFTINSTFGLFGFFDPASEVLGVDYHFEDFGQTLAVWGVDSGPYLMLPFFGPSNPRDFVGRVTDWFMDPVSYLLRKNDRRGLTYVRLGVDYVDKRSRSFEIEKTIYGANDPYNMMKTLYVQNRQFHINDGLVDQDSPVPDDTE
jgi:phospholipid-binding lipoprotein MlaA